LLLLGIIASAHATHGRGAEIRYAHVAGYQYDLQVHIYLNPDSPATIPEIVVDLGDGMLDTVQTTELLTVGGLCTISTLRKYAFSHTYPGPGTYTVSCMIPNRQAGIVNIPGSVDVPLCVSALITVANGWENSSPHFDNYQTVLVINGNALVHDPLVVEEDGDSLSFELVDPSGADCQPVPGYVLPSDIPPSGDSMTIDPSSGVVTWVTPNTLGYFVVAIRCTEWRNGMSIGHVVRDMMLCVYTLPASVHEQSSSPQITIAPSITYGEPVRVNGLATSGAIEVLDAQGRLIERIAVQSDNAFVPTAGLPSGIYWIRMPGVDRALRFEVIRP
jgi:hypothetical protein